MTNSVSVTQKQWDVATLNQAFVLIAGGVSQAAFDVIHVDVTDHPKRERQWPDEHC
jgi:hypothetical protein